jgi:HrpA-like RNA helicase
MVVFQPAGPNEVKVIIATNAAESSITLPDIDRKLKVINLFL